MTRRLIPSTGFDRSLKRLLRRRPQAETAVQEALARLAADAADPRLKTHKLQGDLADQWACRVARDLRIVFRFISDDGDEAVLLLDIGSHDDVY